MARIAFIGLGNMGGPMAENLLKAGHQVCVYDLSADALARLNEVGAETADNAKAAVQGVDFVISMLPASKHVENLYLGDQGIAADIPKSALVIDSSTIDAQTARELAVALNQHGVRFIDAPVSGDRKSTRLN